ncbi:MAG: hypothetical protein IT374_22065 [Polyangiaceae bacterium]|nr:hypothetical protein [Polyangiaceae bacterium]
MIGSYVFAGVFAALSATFLCVSVFFGVAWRLQRREGEFRLFGGNALALSAMTAGLVPQYLAAAASPVDAHAWVLGSALSNSGAFFAIVSGVHFARRLAGKPPVPHGWVAYAAAGALALLAFLPGWWAVTPTRAEEVTFAGMPVLLALGAPGRAALVAYVAISLASLWLVRELVEPWARGRDDSLGPALGAIALSATGIHDALIGLKVVRAVYLSPFGFGALAFSVSVVLLRRYARLSAEVERRAEALRARTDDLERSYRELERTQAELVKKEQLAVVGELAAVIAHEVRNPLAIIANAVAGLRRPLTDPDRLMLLGIIDEENGRLNRLVGELLIYTRPLAPQRQRVALPELVRVALSRREVPLSISVTTSLPPDLPEPHLDGNLVRQVVDNVLGNALQAMSLGGSLHVEVCARERAGKAGLAVVVRDTGEGMNTEVRVKAKTPFFTTRPSGTGLGLAIVDRIMEAHGGKMEIDSKTGIGTTVTLFFPLSGEPEAPRSSRRVSR